jgi:cob(I)alamin adenosyltransferase
MEIYVMADSPRILVITGHGKGKTTSAMGMALRASGHGMSVSVIQFVKQGDTGEMEAMKKLDNVNFTQTGLGFLPKAASQAFEDHKAAAIKGLTLALEAIISDQCDMIVLDEICFAISAGLLGEDDVIEVVSKARADQSVILTGRDASEGIIGIADTVSIIACVKHGFEAGIGAQKGVEY